MEEIKCEQVGMLSGSKWEKCHETNRRVYSDKGISPTLTTMGGGQREVKIIEPMCLNSKVDGKQPSLTDRVYDTNGVSACVTTTPFFMGSIAEPRIAAMRGRNPDNPSDRTAGSPTEQRLEIGSEETSNTLTTVQKDNLVVEPQVINPLAGKSGYSWFFEQNVYAPEGIARALKAGEGSGNIPKVVEPNYRFFEQAFETMRENGCEVGDTIDAYNKKVNKDGVSPTITTRPDGFKRAILPVTQEYRIRKLTERECFRLMGVKAEDFERVSKNQSTSSLYHLAGDSIVTTCLMAIFGQLFGVDYQSKINELVGELRQ